MKNLLERGYVMWIICINSEQNRYVPIYSSLSVRVKFSKQSRTTRHMTSKKNSTILTNVILNFVLQESPKVRYRWTIPFKGKDLPVQFCEKRVRFQITSF